MLSPEEREIALKQMEATVDDFYRKAIGIYNHPFIEFTGIMQAYIKTCRRAHDAGIDFTECNKHSGYPLPMESFEVDYLNEKLNCIFDGRIVCKDGVELSSSNFHMDFIIGEFISLFRGDGESKEEKMGSALKKAQSIMNGVEQIGLSIKRSAAHLFD